MKITRATLRKMWPNAPAHVVSEVARVSEEVFAEFEIEDKLVVAMAMAHISHECGGGTIIRENMSYRAPRIMEIFGDGRDINGNWFNPQTKKRRHSAMISPAEAHVLAGKPRDLSERVYGVGNPTKAKEFNNTLPGDGFRFRGGGMLQLTGKNNYERIGTMVGVDLLHHPELLEDPAISFRVAIAEFVKLQCVKPSLSADINPTKACEITTLRINGGYNGLAEREVWFKKWKSVLDRQIENGDDEQEPTRPGPVPTPVPEPSPIPEPEEPRGGESDQPDKPSRSKTLWSVITGIISSMAMAVWNWISDNPQWFILIICVLVAALFIVVGRARLREIFEQLYSKYLNGRL